MSRLSQFIEFINKEDIPSKNDMELYYTSISKTPELIQSRKEYRKELKKDTIMTLFT